jgi:hypothetical protein
MRHYDHFPDWRRAAHIAWAVTVVQSVEKLGVSSAGGSGGRNGGDGANSRDE